jgi:hypothetical protein
MDADNILLDPKIKTHVLLPITLIMLLVHVLRQFLILLLKPKQQLQKMTKLRENQHLQNCTMTAQNGWSALCKSEWEYRKSYIFDQYTKRNNLNKILSNPIVEKKIDTAKETTSEMKNPFTESGLNETLWEGMKSNLVNYLPQPILMFYMSLLFRGYIALKLPFTPTSNFKPMLQSSIMTTDLDVSYVTGISWYFVNLLGVESLSKVLLSLFGISPLSDKPEETVLENITSIISTGNNPVQNSNQQQGMFGQPKTEDLLKKQASSIKLLNFRSCLVNVEERLVTKFETI